MKFIPLTQGKFARVDDADFGLVSQYKWYAYIGVNSAYAVSNQPKPNGKIGTIFMHRIILEKMFPGNFLNSDFGDHKDLDGLNNQRHNLRKANKSQNAGNQGVCKHNQTGLKGVFVRSRNLGKTNQYSSQIKRGNKRVGLGLFPTAILAARAYDKAAVEYWGEFARTNKMMGLID